MRAAFPAALTLVAVACSGAATPSLYGSHDGGVEGATSSGGSSGGSGSSGGADAMPMGDDEADATTLPPPDAAPDAHEASGPACMPSPPDAGACNSVAAPPSSVAVTCDAADPVPAPVGGVIRDGVYRLTSSTYYAGGSTCPTPETDGVAWEICGASWQIAQNDSVNGSPQPPLFANATVVQTGANLSITITCGLMETQPLLFGYDADATTLRLHIGGGTTATSGRVDTFARQ
ncbi:MAG TPA: hypothetical protein VHS09_03790 [Polyangiaceae bacterium]|jgi:hypothetical protein|nr:hypothetical protein [Polyangiaceae bacterium]